MNKLQCDQCGATLTIPNSETMVDCVVEYAECAEHKNVFIAGVRFEAAGGGVLIGEVLRYQNETK